MSKPSRSLLLSYSMLLPVKAVFLTCSSSLKCGYLSCSLKAITLPGTTCNKVHSHTWNFPPAHQRTVQGSVHSVDTVESPDISTRIIGFISSFYCTVQISHLPGSKSQQLNVWSFEVLSWWLVFSSANMIRLSSFLQKCRLQFLYNIILCCHPYLLNF